MQQQFLPHLKKLGLNTPGNVELLTEFFRIRSIIKRPKTIEAQMRSQKKKLEKTLKPIFNKLNVKGRIEEFKDENEKNHALVTIMIAILKRCIEINNSSTDHPFLSFRHILIYRSDSTIQKKFTYTSHAKEKTLKYAEGQSDNVLKRLKKIFPQTNPFYNLIFSKFNDLENAFGNAMRQYQEELHLEDNCPKKQLKTDPSAAGIAPLLSHENFDQSPSHTPEHLMCHESLGLSNKQQNVAVDTSSLLPIQTPQLYKNSTQLKSLLFQPCAQPVLDQYLSIQQSLHLFEQEISPDDFEQRLLGGLAEICDITGLDMKF